MDSSMLTATRGRGSCNFKAIRMHYYKSSDSYMMSVAKGGGYSNMTKWSVISRHKFFEGYCLACPKPY